MTTGATPPSLNTATRRRLRRLTVGTPFRCALALSSLPGTSPVPPSRSPATPCCRLAADERATAPTRARGDRAGAPVLQQAAQAAQAVFPAGLGCQAVAQPAFQPTAPRGL
jgi:hypothetical protein